MSAIPGEYLARFAPHMKSLPVDVAACAQAVGLPIYAIDLPRGVSGMLVRHDPKAGDSGYVCYVDSSEPSVRQRFTAAHELGHFVLHRHLLGDTHKDNYLLRAEGFTGRQETQANTFAADLLMPRDLIEQKLEEGLTSVEALAKAFGVSKVAMSIRLGLPT
ncbi:MAG TPA: ImmA/IrrE family metallo-endopeptidase [Pedomonas sp.]|nr:ImmA/IrrE family metallo-endopeptidase [Pedomonas sp.]